MMLGWVAESFSEQETKLIARQKRIVVVLNLKNIV